MRLSPNARSRNGIKHSASSWIAKVGAKALQLMLEGISARAQAISSLPANRQSAADGLALPYDRR